MSNDGQEPPRARIGQVLHPVRDVRAAVDFYARAFGFTAKYVDGLRFAALDAGGTTLALAAPEEDLTAGTPAAAVKVADVATTVADVVAAGGQVLHKATPGPHEIRAVIRDPWGNTLIVYGPR
jgi:predicted enzyme related to lactoylglutathione lyase